MGRKSRLKLGQWKDYHWMQCRIKCKGNSPGAATQPSSTLSTGFNIKVVSFIIIIIIIMIRISIIIIITIFNWWSVGLSAHQATALASFFPVELSFGLAMNVKTRWLWWWGGGGGGWWSRWFWNRILMIFVIKRVMSWWRLWCWEMVFTQVPLEFIFKTLRDADIFIKNNIGPGEVKWPLFAGKVKVLLWRDVSGRRKWKYFCSGICRQWKVKLDYIKWTKSGS